MEDTDVAWHQDQAAAIVAYEESIKTGEVHLAQIWWEVGESLNDIYGMNFTGKRDVETEIPLMDLATLRDIYKAASTDSVRKTMNRARTFHRKAPSAEQRDAAIKEYRTWTRIYELFCSGLPPQQIQRNVQPHMMNVPDFTVQYVASKLGSFKEAQNAIRYFMRIVDPDQIVNSLSAAESAIRFECSKVVKVSRIYPAS